MQWKLSVISPISRTVPGLPTVEAIKILEGGDLEEATAFGCGIRETDWLMIGPVAFEV